MDADNPDERFPPSGGRVPGALSILIGLGVVALAVVDAGGVSWAGVAVGVLVLVLGWVVFLRPRVSIEDDALVLRGMVQTRHVPLAAVEEVAVRQVLAVRAGDKRYTSPAVGRSRREMRRAERPGLRGAGAAGRSPDVAAADVAEDRVFGAYVEERIRARARDARTRLGIRAASAEQDELAASSTRTWAVPEITLLVASTAATVVLVAV